MKKYAVQIIESERGWGTRVDEVKTFDTEAEAMTFVKQYNAKYNTKKEVPDWYMAAEYVGEVLMKSS